MRVAAALGRAVFTRDRGEPWDRTDAALSRCGARWEREAHAHVVCAESAAEGILALKTDGFNVHGTSEVVQLIRGVVRVADSRLARLGDTGSLMPHQSIAARFLAQRSAAMLRDEMGLGKTRAALAATGSVGRAVVLCPAGVMDVWRCEPSPLRAEIAKRWTEPPQGGLSVLSLDSLKDGDTATRGLGPLSLLVDECHLVGGGTARARRVEALAQSVLDGGGAVWGLTATPVRNDPMGLWQMLCSLRMEAQSFGSFARFLRAFRGKKLPFGYEFGGADDALVEAALRRVSLRRTEDVLATRLPAMRHESHLVMLSQASIEEIEREIESAGIDPERVIDLALSDEKEISVASWAPVRRAVALAKVPAALRFLAERRGSRDSPWVVFTTSPDAAALIAKRAEGQWTTLTGETPTKARWDRVRAFQRGDLDGMVLTVRCGGTGLTLTRSDRVLFLDKDWSHVGNVQAESRVHRIGQTRDVTVHSLVCSHHAELSVERVLRHKAKSCASVDAAEGEAWTPLDASREFLRGLVR